jgi:hypothetical protein
MGPVFRMRSVACRNHGGTVSDALNALTFDLQEGKGNLVISTAANPVGEIAGFFAPVPEHLSTVLMLAGLALAGVAWRRRG